MQQLIERMFDGFLFDSPPSLPLKSLKTDIYDYRKYAPPIYRYIGWRSILILTDFNHFFINPHFRFSL